LNQKYVIIVNLFQLIVPRLLKFHETEATMRTCSYLSRHQKEMIVRLREQNKTQRQIATLVGCTQAGVSKMLQRSLQPNGLEVRPKSGRKRVTTDKEDRIFRREYMKDRTMSASELAKIVQAATPHDLRVP
jgi:predicted transcriptional regulator